MRLTLNGLSHGVVLSQSEESDTHCGSLHGLPRARLIIAFLFFACTLVDYNSAAAHPLGNFSINHFSGIRVTRDAVEVRYGIDMAEIPTFQEIQATSIVPKAGDPGLDSYLTEKAKALGERLFLQVNGRRLRLQPESKEIIFPPGAGGLPTMKIGILYKAKLTVDAAPEPCQLNYRDENFPGRAGWKEIVATAGDRVKIVDSSVPEADRSAELSDYPTDLLNSPPQDLEARLFFVASNVSPVVASVEHSRTKGSFQAKAAKVASLPGQTAPSAVLGTVSSPDMNSGLPRITKSESVQLQANRQSTPRNAFTELIAAKQLKVGIILFALVVAVGLGAFHALEPGHGKTLVAAYLVGSGGTVKHAVLLGLIVTATHTAGVYLLGLVTLYASQYIVPDRLYPWLGGVSGVMIAALGLVLLVRRYLGKDELVSRHHDGHTHQHHHHHDHDHAHHSHGGHPHHHGKPIQNVSLKQLLALGISGGIVPCPAALVVLLSAIAMQRIGFGLLLIVAFSGGLAAALIAIGLLMVCARQFMRRIETDGELITRWLPLASSIIITLFGFGMVAQAIGAGYFSI